MLTRSSAPLVLASIACSLLGCAGATDLADGTQPRAVTPPSAATSSEVARAPSAAPTSRASAPSPAQPIEATPQQTINVAPGIDVRITPEGTGLFRLGLAIAADVKGDVNVDVERHDAREAGPAKETLTRTLDWSQHSAVSGVTYAYRFRAAGGDWTAPVEARTARPSAPPPTPTNLTVKALDAFTAELEWKADTTTTTGIEIEVEQDGEWTRAVIANPRDEVVHRGRWPGATYEYQARAFNAVGVSEWSASVKVTVPKLGSPPKLASKLGPCVKLPEQAPETHVIGRDQLRDAPEELINEPDATDSYTRHFIGRAKGCLRDLGTTLAQANIDVVRGLDEGAVFPMLSVIAGAGIEGAQFRYLRFDGARYEQVHEVVFCGDPWVSGEPSLFFGSSSGDDVRAYQPPFQPCQYSSDLRRD